jgi:hypothetical protein
MRPIDDLVVAALRVDLDDVDIEPSQDLVEAPGGHEQARVILTQRVDLMFARGPARADAARNGPVV